MSRGVRNNKTVASTEKKNTPKIEKQPKRSSVSSEIQTLRDRVIYLEAENGRLIAEKQMMTKRIQEVKAGIETKLRDIQEGVARRMDRGESNSSIMDYIKAGFGAMLGALAALLVVNLAIDAFDSLTSVDSANSNANAVNTSAVAEDNNDISSTTAEYGNDNGQMSGDGNDMFALFGGRIGMKKEGDDRSKKSTRIIHKTKRDKRDGSIQSSPVSGSSSHRKTSQMQKQVQAERKDKKKWCSHDRM